MYPDYRISQRKKGDLLQGRYRIDSVLGKGGFGITYAGWDQWKETRVAIKEYHPAALIQRTGDGGGDYLVCAGEDREEYQRGMERFTREAKSLFQFSGVPGIVRVLDFFTANGTAYLVTEFVEGISLQQYLKKRGGRLSEKEVLEIMKPLFPALLKIHEAGVIHRDISPENIMLTFPDGDSRKPVRQVTLIDFGSARQAHHQKNGRYTVVLKHGYAPEEQYRAYGDQGPWTDVYALCATIYRCICGSLPPNSVDRLWKENEGVDPLRTEIEGTVLSKKTKNALEKGLALRKEERTASVKALYRQLYGKAIPENHPAEKPVKRIPFFLAVSSAAAVFLLLLVFFRRGTTSQSYAQEKISEAGYVRISGKDVRSLEDGETVLLQVKSNLEHLDLEYDHHFLKADWADPAQKSLRIEAVERQEPLTDTIATKVTVSGMSKRDGKKSEAALYLLIGNRKEDRSREVYG